MSARALPAAIVDEILRRDLENITTKVQGGGTLSATERALLEKMRGPASAPSPASAEKFTLTQEEQLPGQLAPSEWSTTYGLAPRLIARWKARGLQKDDPCPFHTPAKMMPWVERNVGKIHARIRANIEAAAAKARPVAEQPARPHSAPAADTPSVASIDLATVGGVDGDSVQLFRQLFAATKIQLTKAYADGDEDTIRTLTARLDKIGESLRKHEKAAEEKAKRNREWLPRAEVITDLTEAVTLIRGLLSKLPARITDELPDLSPDTLTRIAAVTERLVTQTRNVLAQAPSLRGSADAAALFSLS